MLQSSSRLTATGVFLFCAAVSLGNTPPSAPVITEPGFDGRVVNAEDAHMEAGPFVDADPGDTHVCTDWQIWTVSPSALVWATTCITGVERVHTHLGDGVFQGSHAGRASLIPSTNYQLRVRFRDSSGEAATEWSAFSIRLFSTAPGSAVLPMELEDIALTPAPTLTDVFNVPVILPAGATAPSIRLEAPDGGLLLAIEGDDGSGNLVVNPAPLGMHVDARVHALGGSTGLVLADTDLRFQDAHGESHAVYIPAMNLSGGQEVYFWIASSGSTYAAQPAQTTPDFSILARGPAVPFVALQPGYRVEVAASGFQLPVNIAFVPNPGVAPTSPLYYVTELYGTIKVVRRDGVVGTYASGLLNFSPTGAFPGSGEQGLTGIVVDPTNGDIYAGMLYDSAPPNGAHYPKVVRFTSNDGGLTAATQTIIRNMTGETQGQSHQISNFSFGPDGKLYVHMGDGFDSSTGQNLASYRGKILRMNRDGTAPSDNPFYNAGDGITARDYVYAYGLRNPFGGDWRAADGKLYEVENGPTVDRLAKVNVGQNYLYNGSDASMLNGAIYTWSIAHGPVNMAFVQPEKFAGSGFPAEKQGKMFISESGPTWGTGPQVLGKRIVEFTLNAAGAVTGGPTTLVEYNGTGKATCVGLAAGPDGLYFTDLYKDLGYTSPIDGGARVLRIRYVGTADFSADVTQGAAPLAVQFTDTSNAPNVTARTWSFGDGGTSTATNPTHVYPYEGLYNVRLTLTTPSGLIVQQKNAYIVVGPPAPRVALIGGSNPPAAGDAAVVEHLEHLGFQVTAYDDEPANRPSAATIGAQNDLVLVSSTITAANVAGQFRTVNVPLVFWEQGLLRTDREGLSDGGIARTAVTAINVTTNLHPITQGLATGPLTVFSASSNMSVSTGAIAPTVSALATRSGAPTDTTIMAANAGVTLLSGYVAPARRVFLFFEDAGLTVATPAAEDLLQRAGCWAIGKGAPTVVMPAGQTVLAGGTVTLTATVGGGLAASMQWSRDGVPLFDSGRIAGANGPVLTISPVKASDAGAYTLTATSPCGETVGAATSLSIRPRGDADCSGVLDLEDVVPFVQALVDPVGYAATYPECQLTVSDVNGDGQVDGLDVNTFTAALVP